MSTSSEAFYVLYSYTDPSTEKPRKGQEGPYDLQKALDRRTEIGKSIGLEHPYIEVVKR